MTTRFKHIALITTLSCYGFAAQATEPAVIEPININIAIVSLQDDLKIELDELKQDLVLPTPKTVLPAEMMTGETLMASRRFKAPQPMTIE